MFSPFGLWDWPATGPGGDSVPGRIVATAVVADGSGGISSGAASMRALHIKHFMSTLKRRLFSVGRRSVTVRYVVSVAPSVLRWAVKGVGTKDEDEDGRPRFFLPDGASVITCGANLRTTLSSRHCP